MATTSKAYVWLQLDPKPGEFELNDSVTIDLEHGLVIDHVKDVVFETATGRVRVPADRVRARPADEQRRVDEACETFPEAHFDSFRW